MRVSIMGDSISTYEGFNPAGYRVFYDADRCAANGLSSAHDTWWMQVLDAMGAELLVNNSFSGSQVTGEGFPCASGFERTGALGTTDASPDLVLVYIGVNDFGFSVPCDKEYAETPDEPTFFEAYCTMLNRMHENYPGARIVCGTILTPCKPDDPSWSFDEKWSHLTPLDEFNARIRQAAAQCGALVADLSAAANDAHYDSRDGLHPDKHGHAQIAALWMSELRRLKIARGESDVDEG